VAEQRRNGGGATAGTPAERTVRVRNPRGQGERLREEILRAAGGLLEQVGSEDALSLRAVAREVGIATPSIYRHFSDKTDLVWAVLAEHYERLAGIMAEADASAPADDPLERLRSQLTAYCRFAVANPAKYRLMCETWQTPVDEERLHGHPAGLLLRGLSRALTACEEGGWRVRGTREEAPYMLWYALHGRIALWQVMPRRKDTVRLDRFVDELLNLMLER
jgi:AcrR family transcriptional regulator